jgi:DNA invertase Pin-like site-specific DNA recombinase
MFDAPSLRSVDWSSRIFVDWPSRIFVSLAEYERELINERAADARAAARTVGGPRDAAGCRPPVELGARGRHSARVREAVGPARR